jgi:hypothetical protein
MTISLTKPAQGFSTWHVEINQNWTDIEAAVNELIEAIPAGTKMLFQQTTAPTGWTKDTTHNNKALRVVTGTAGSGGVNAFTTALNSNVTSSSAGSHSHTITVNNHTLTSAQIPAHSHGIRAATGVSGPGAYALVYSADTATGSGATALDGGSGGAHNHGASSESTGAHTHTLNMNVQYVDLIIATRA